ncbi:TnsD family Tn7-like transposition protein [Pseudomonas amygdali]|uniref:TnsD family Tn7-like transposition protein n=1 Tax=Pseudomonas amygdali TaxID=47877 RepID=UPI0016053BB9|nr:TnsD family Tn7-like transposition protein [Pseudomonas amygdali]
MADRAKSFDEKAPATPPPDNNEPKGVTSHQIFKPKKMFVDVKKRVLASLAGGASKKRTCEEFGISISTINRILRLNPVVAKKISVTAKKNINLQKREKWRTTALNNPGLGVTEIRKMIPDVYAWLYRNEKHWLKMQKDNLPNRRRGNYSTVSWNDRDEALCARITDTIIEHHATSETPRKYAFYELVPGLYSALESKSHYAKTRKLLDDLTKSGPDGDYWSASPIRMSKT